MKYFFDLEFLEDGETIDLISIGIVAEDGREFYAVNEEANWSRIINHDWLRVNVVPHLPIEVNPLADGKYWGRIQPNSHWDIEDSIRQKLLDFIGDDKPEFWSYFADYDWVCLAQLFGRMIDLPKGWPMYCRDIKQLCDSLGNPTLPPQEGEHQALNDARWNKQAYEFLRDTNPWTKLLRNLNGKRVVAESDNPEFATIEYSVCLSNAELDRLRRLVA